MTEAVQNLEAVDVVPLDYVGVSTDELPDLLERVKPENLTRVVALFCYGRSGSNFVASLFDSHPQILNTPSTQIAGFYDFWREYGERPAVEQLAAFLSVYEAMYRVHQLGNVPMNPHAGPLSGDASPVDASLFQEVFLTLASRAVSDPNRECIPRRYFVQSLHAAYAIALRREVNWDDAVIFMHVHSPISSVTDPLLEDFPDAQLLHVIRRPTASLSSYYRIAISGGIGGGGLTAFGIEWALNRAQPVSASAAELSRAVKIEDVNEAPEETLRSICCWVGISWNDCLLEPTFNSVPYTQSSSHGHNFKDFAGKQQEARNVQACSRIDWVRLKFLLAPVYAEWGYSIGAVYRSAFLRRLSRFLWLFPFRVERKIYGREVPSFTFEAFGRFLDHCVSLRRMAFGCLTSSGEVHNRMIRLLGGDEGSCL